MELGPALSGSLVSYKGDGDWPLLEQRVVMGWWESFKPLALWWPTSSEAVATRVATAVVTSHTQPAKSPHVASGLATMAIAVGHFRRRLPCWALPN